MLVRGYVYTLSKKDIPFYVGSTFDLLRRKKEHLSGSGSGVTFDVIDEIEANEKECKIQLLKLEFYWIEQFLNWGFVLENNHGNKSKKVVYINGVHTRFNSELFTSMVKEKRSNANASLREAAVSAKVKHSTIFRIENNLPIDLDNTLAICDWLGKSIGDFIIYEKEPLPTKNKK